MIPRALACAAVLLHLAACSGTGERGASGTKAPNDGAPAPAAESERQVGARFAPSLEALRSAVEAGDDELARALIAHADSLGPDESTWQFVRAYERILDGRAAVKHLVLELDCLSEPPEKLPGDVQPGAQAWRLVLRARNTSAEAIQLRPGPASLHTNRTDLDRRGAVSSTQVTRSFDSLKSIEVGPNAQVEIELARFFLAPPAGLLALSMDFELELRSGVLERDGRELPAMHLAVAPARAARHAEDLPEGTLTPAELFAASAGLTESDELLALAVRTDPGPAGSGLLELERSVSGLVSTRLELWLPALRWLAGPDVPKDVDLARAWLKRRGEAAMPGAPKPSLVLPRAAAPVEN